MIHNTLRIGRLVVGILLLIAGAVLSLPMVPGPGLVLVFFGLTLLGNEFHWARRLRDWMHTSVRRIGRRTDGRFEGPPRE